jgi:hypothetical protein
MPAPKADWKALFRSNNGLDLPNAETQADWIMEQMLEGTTIGDGTRITVRNYLVMHLEAAEERGRKRMTHNPPINTDPRWRS